MLVKHIYMPKVAVVHSKIGSEGAGFLSWIVFFLLCSFVFMCVFVFFVCVLMSLSRGATECPEDTKATPPPEIRWSP